MLELYNDRLIDLLAPHGKEVSFDSENVFSFLWDKEINIVNHSFVVIVQYVVYVSDFKRRTILVYSGYSTTNEE